MANRSNKPVVSRPGTLVTEGAAHMFNKRGWRGFVYSVWKGSANRLDRYQDRNVRGPVPIEVQGTGVVPTGKRGSQGVILGGATPLIA